MCIKLKYIQISSDLYQHISYHAQNQKKGLANQNLENNLVTPRL